MSAIKRTAADAAFSDAMRWGADWTCERCGTRYEPPTSALHLSHFHGRGEWATRTDPDNGDCLCYGCHRYFGSRPQMYAQWKEDKMGEVDYAGLEIRSRDTMLGKQSRRGDKNGEIAAHYRSEVERIKQIRSLGVVGKLQVTPWYSPATVEEARKQVEA